MSLAKIAEESKKARPWQITLRRFFAQPWVEISIGLLVLASVGLTLLEFAIEAQLAQSGPTDSAVGRIDELFLHRVMVVNDLITLIFIVELTLRYLAAVSKARFFREFWIDIVATIPIFRVFRSARALRLLRLVRIVRLVGVFSRLSLHYPSIFRRGALEFLMISGLLLMAVMFGTVAMMHAENGIGLNGNPDPDLMPALVDAKPPLNPNQQDDLNLEESFWFSIYTLFAGEPVPYAPKSVWGKIVSVFLMFMGLTIFAIFAGTVSAFMVDRIRMEGRIVECDELRDHIVICGWTPKTEIIIREYRYSAKTKKTPIVVVSQLEQDRMNVGLREMKNVFFVDDDFTKVSALERAGIPRASTCLVLADLSDGRNEQDADARTILAALTVEKMNEEVHTCAELLNADYATHLHLGKVNDIVVSDEYGAYMLAQAASNSGSVEVMDELLTYQRGNEFRRAPVPKSWVGQTFNQKMTDLKATQNAILVAVYGGGEEAIVNPEKYEFTEGDEVVAICKGTLKLKK